MCRYCEPKMEYGIEPLAEVTYLPNMVMKANLAYLNYGRYMLEFYVKHSASEFGIKKAVECNYCPKCGRPLHCKRKK